MIDNVRTHLQLATITSCQWTNNASLTGLWKQIQTGMLLYGPVKQYKNTDLGENKRTWHYLCRNVI